MTTCEDLRAMGRGVIRAIQVLDDYVAMTTRDIVYSAKVGQTSMKECVLLSRVEECPDFLTKYEQGIREKFPDIIITSEMFINDKFARFNFSWA